MSNFQCDNVINYLPFSLVIDSFFTTTFIIIHLVQFHLRATNLIIGTCISLCSWYLLSWNRYVLISSTTSFVSVQSTTNLIILQYLPPISRSSFSLLSLSLSYSHSPSPFRSPLMSLNFPSPSHSHSLLSTII